MSHDIILRFPNKKMAEEFCGQMSDGVGGLFADFSYWQKKPGTTGKNKEDYEKITSSAPDGTEVYFIRDIWSAELC